MNPVIFDEAITDRDLLSEIESNRGIFPESMGDTDRVGITTTQYHDAGVDCYAPFMFWDGWWNSTANTTRKKMIKNLLENRIPIPVNEICGIEYWTRTFSPGQYLDWHVDEDTFLYERSKEFNCPKVGFVYYPHYNKENESYLIISNAAVHGNPVAALERGHIYGMMEFAPGQTSIQYRPNRLVMFDAGRSIHKTTKSDNAERRVMVINVWTKDNPPLALELGTFFYE